VAIKNVKACQDRLRKLLAQVPRGKGEPADSGDSTTILVESILEADTTHKEASAAREALFHEFLDFNELRVATPREIADCWPADFPGATEKAEALRRALNSIFDRTYQMSLDFLQKVPKRDLRKQLAGIGLGPYAAAKVMLSHFHVPAVPVDQSLLETLEIEGHVPAGATVDEVQEMLERLVGPRGAHAAHLFLRALVEKNAKGLLARRKKESQAAAREARVAEEARAQAAAEAKAAAEAAAAKAAAAEAQAASEAKAKGRKSAAAKIRRAARKRA
jgi:endonuclease III